MKKAWDKFKEIITSDVFIGTLMWAVIIFGYIYFNDKTPSKTPDEIYQECLAKAGPSFQEEMSERQDYKCYEQYLEDQRDQYEQEERDAYFDQGVRGY